MCHLSLTALCLSHIPRPESGSRGWVGGIREQAMKYIYIYKKYIHIYIYLRNMKNDSAEEEEEERRRREATLALPPGSVRFHCLLPDTPYSAPTPGLRPWDVTEALLLSQGANIHSTDIFGRTALHRGVSLFKKGPFSGNVVVVL